MKLPNTLPDAEVSTSTSSRIGHKHAIRALTLIVAIVAYSGVALADPGAGATTSAGTLLPLQGDEFCSTEAGEMLDSILGIVIIVFFAAILLAIFVAGAIEANPMTGWWNQVGYSMMGKIPVAVIFVVVMLSVLDIIFGSVGVDIPSCIPILG